MYTRLDLEGIDFERDINFPGAYPYTCGVHAARYRGKMWTMRQFSGMGNAQQNNKRYHFLLNKGQEKAPAQIDCWLRNGSAAYVEGIGICDDPQDLDR